MTEEQVQAEADEAAGEPASEADALRTQLAGAARRYRELLLAGSPEVPAELVAGTTVEEVDASFAAARGVVQEVRRRIEEQAGAAGYAAVEWASFATNRTNLGGEHTWRDYLTWGQDRLSAFMKGLSRHSRKNAVRSRRLYRPAEPMQSQSTDWGP